MLQPAIKDKALAFDSLSAFFKGDRVKAWTVLSSLDADL